VEKLETEMAETRREYNAARSEASEARRLPPGPDRTARLTRLAERMENMVARIETLEQEIRKLRSSI
jgi:outer membrane murein-binding lipoprotein Lpp